MADLVSLDEMKAFINTDRARAQEENGVLDMTLDQIEALLEADLNRTEVPFQEAEAGRIEDQDGTGSPTVWVDYPIDTVTTIELGHDPAEPIETLDPTNPEEVAIIPGDRRIRRVSSPSTHGLEVRTRRRRRGRGPAFGPWNEPLFVHVTYDTRDDLPDAAKLAVVRGTTLIWAQRGMEEANRHRLPDLTVDLKKLIDDMPEWQKVVQLLRRPEIQ